MGQSGLTFMDAKAWHAQAWEFLCRCVASSSVELGGCIREANHLFRIGPEAFGVSLSSLGEEKAVAALLDAGASESATFALLGRETAFMVSRAVSGSYLATVVLPGRTEEFTARGRTLELALLAAKTAALLAEAENALGMPRDALVPKREKAGIQAG